MAWNKSFQTPIGQSCRDFDERVRTQGICIPTYPHPAQDISIDKLNPGARVALRNDSYTLHLVLPTKVDPLVSLMKVEKVGRSAPTGDGKAVRVRKRGKTGLCSFVKEYGFAIGMALGSAEWLSFHRAGLPSVHGGSLTGGRVAPCPGQVRERSRSMMLGVVGSHELCGLSRARGLVARRSNAGFCGSLL